MRSVLSAPLKRLCIACVPQVLTLASDCRIAIDQADPLGYGEITLRRGAAFGEGWPGVPGAAFTIEEGEE